MTYDSTIGVTNLRYIGARWTCKVNIMMLTQFRVQDEYSEK